MEEDYHYNCQDFFEFQGEDTLMNIESVSIKGSNEWNEDALILNEKFSIYGVADGATSLVPYRSTKGETGGRRASQIVKNYFEGISDSENKSSLEELMINANTLLGNEMIKEDIDTVKKDNVWTTGAAILRVFEHQIEYVQTGDCMIIALYSAGDYRVITRDQIAYFDNNSKNEWVKAIREGLSTQKEIRKRVEPTIRKQKSKINTLDGYSVLDGSREAASFLETGKINRIKLSGLIICSDGLFPHDEINSINKNDTMGEIAKGVSSLGMKGYINRLNEIEKEDPECLKYPRTKRSDDKSGIYIKF